MLTIKPILLGSALALAFAGPTVAQDTPASADPDMVVATVGGENITLGHMIALRQALPAQYDQLPDAVLFPEIREQLIQQTALSQSGDGLTNSARLRLENERRALLASEQIAEFAAAEISEEDLRAAYDTKFADFTPQAEYNASHILVETEEEAQEIVAELEAGADFATLARERSTGPSGPNGGNLGWFGVGAMVPTFEAAVVAMQPETVSPPVQTQFGWHVIRLNETRTKGAPSLDEVRGEVLEEVRMEKIRAAVDAVVEATEVERADLDEIDPNVLSNGALIE